LLDDIRRSLDRIAVTGVAMELNTSGLNKALPEMNPGRPILEEMVRRDIPVVVGADAHNPQRVAANFEDAFDLLQAVGYTQVNIFLNRQRHALDLATARQSLRTN
jgi:histidinol-phosphatase (PHP family)